MRVRWLLLTLASLATLSSASSGCWSEVISGRSPGANIVSKGSSHSVKGAQHALLPVDRLAGLRLEV